METRPAEHGQPATLRLERPAEGVLRLVAGGNWRAESLDAVARLLNRSIRAWRNLRVEWDFSGIEAIDPAGMMLYRHSQRRLQARGCRVEVTAANDAWRTMHHLLDPWTPSEVGTGRPTWHRLLIPLAALGRSTVNGWRDLMAFLAFLGESTLVFLRGLAHPLRFRWDSLTRVIEDAGLRALPIITLTAFLIGVVIAYQGAVQLRRFGANLFIVDMIGISVTRELAPLITAIVVAGRTGSAFTAELGVMKITEEIDAMRVMGFDPMHFLVVPRILALMIALPLLIFFADLVGIFGGMVVAHLHLGLSWSEFLHRLQSAVAVRHFWIGIFKGPFFAWLIAMVGCFRGLQVARNTESIGRYTTISVVNSIFLVIACDALFSVILTELDL